MTPMNDELHEALETIRPELLAMTRLFGLPEAHTGRTFPGLYLPGGGNRRFLPDHLYRRRRLGHPLRSPAGQSGPPGAAAAPPPGRPQALQADPV